MKIEDLANLQDILKCNKDKTKAKEIRAKKKVIDQEARIIKYKIEKLRAKHRDLTRQSTVMKNVLVQSRNLIIVNDTPIAIIKYGRSIRITKAGTHLIDGWPRSDFEITLESNCSNVYYVRSSNGHYYSTTKTKIAKRFKSKEVVEDIGRRYVAGLLTSADVEAQIYED